MACNASLDDASDVERASVDVLLLLICSELLSAVSEPHLLTSKGSTAGELPSTISCGGGATVGSLGGGGTTTTTSSGLWGNAILSRGVRGGCSISPSSSSEGGGAGNSSSWSPPSISVSGGGGGSWGGGGSSLGSARMSAGGGGGSWEGPGGIGAGAEFAVVEVVVTVLEASSCWVPLLRVTEVDDSLTEDETRKF